LLSSGSWSGGTELACQSLLTVLLNFGFLVFGVTAYASKLTTAHYGAITAREPRPPNDEAAGRQAGRAGGLRLGQRRGGPPRAQKDELKPHRKERWVIPPQASGEFVARMEDILEVYHRLYDERRLLACLDEVPVQRAGESRVPPAPGRLVRYDYEYVRNSTADLLMAFEPLSGWRWVKAAEPKAVPALNRLRGVARLLPNKMREGQRIGKRLRCTKN
jgi:hypothetical protein